MGYFANISSSLVVEHFTGDTIPTTPGTWISHSYAHVDIGFTYDSDSQVFYPPQPYPSFTLDKETQMWDPPIAEPIATGSEVYGWDESTGKWFNKL